MDADPVVCRFADAGPRDANGLRIVRCAECLRSLPAPTKAPLNKIGGCLAESRPPPSHPPDHGPGTELHKLIAALSITPDASCGCEAMASKMNAWGIEGCQEHREEILAHLKSAYANTDWATAANAMLAGVLAAWSCNMNPIDPFGSLLNEALRRAEKHNAK